MLALVVVLITRRVRLSEHTLNERTILITVGATKTVQ